ncbi:MAG: hypothetical protein ABJC36_04070 [Gemmatimonadales bacterium]
MTPTVAKATILALGLLSLVLLAGAAREWLSRDAAPDRNAPGPSGLRGALILFAVSAAVAVSLWVAAPAVGWGRDRMLWVGVGGFLAVLTLLQPWWFWDNWRARGLRNLIGDEGTALCYLALAAVMVWVGMFTDWTFGRR